MNKKLLHNLIVCALFTSLLAICSQIQIPLPMIPINLALFAVFLSGSLLETKFAVLSVVMYIMLGLCGIPVFSGFQAGFSVLFGKTGGYIIGYIFCVYIISFCNTKFALSPIQNAFSMVFGLFVCYMFGTIYFMLLTHTSFYTALLYCVIPFLIGDCIKIFLATYIADRLKTTFKNSKQKI